MIASARPWVLCVLALVGSVGAAPSAARASCGDYVHVGETPSENAKPEQARPKPEPAPQPCTGPRCSRGDVPMTAPVSAPTAHEWACPMPPALLDPDGESAVCLAWQDRPVSGLPLSVYHPPRQIL
jgi:hypothetical protein